MAVKGFWGAELGKNVGFVEQITGAINFATSPVHFGNYSYRVHPSAAFCDLSFSFGALETGSDRLGQYKGYGVDGVGCYIQFWLYIATQPSADITFFSLFHYGGGQSLRVMLSTTGVLLLQTVNGSTPTDVGSSSALNTGQWYKIGFSVSGLTSSGTTAGVADLSVDGTSVASASGRTISASTAFYLVSFGDPSVWTADFYIDDMVIDDAAYPTLDMVEYPPLLANGAGTDADWTGTFADVDENPYDSATFLSLSGTGAETVTLADCSTVGINSDQIAAVIPFCLVATNGSDAAARVQVRLRSGATTDETAWVIAPSNSTTFFKSGHQVYITNPNTSASWTRAGIDAIEVGPNKTAGSVETRVTEIGARVLAKNNGLVPAPTVSSINPASGPKAGGTAVTITGTKFTGATQVLIGGVAATSLTVVNDTTITCTTAAVSKAGPGSVTVTTLGGSATLLNGFTFTPGNSGGNGGNNAGGAATLVLTMPSTATGDQLIAVITLRGTGSTATQASWTQIDSRSDGTNSVTKTFKRISTGGSEPASYTWTTSNVKASGVITSTPDVDTTAGPQVISQANASSANVVAPTLTPRRLGSVSLFGGGTAVGTTFTPPGSYTEPANADQASTGGAAGTRTTDEQAYRQLATLTATGTLTGVAGAAATNVGVQVMLDPPTVISPVAIDSAESVGTPTLSIAAGITSIQPTAIASGEAVGSHTLIPGPVTISPTGIASAEAVGTPSVQRDISPVAINSVEAVGTPILVPGSVTVQPGAIASSEALGVPTLKAIANILPSAIPSAESVGSPILKATANIQPSAIASAEASGNPILIATANILPSAIPSAEAVGNPTLVGIVAQSILPTAIASGEALGNATLLPGAVVIQPTAIASGEVLGAVTLVAIANILPSAVAPAEAFGNPVLLPGGVTVAPSSIPTAEAVGTPSLIASAVILPSAIGSAEVVSNPTLVLVAAIQPTGIPTAQVVGTPALIATAAILPTAVPTAEALGTPVLKNSASILPTAIGSAEALGNPTLSVGGVLIQPTAVASAEAFGTPILVGAQQVINPAGIPSAEAVGTPLLRLSTLSVQAISSAEAVGTPTLIATANILPSGIASGQALGNPTLQAVAQILPTGIPSAEAVGTPTIKAGNVNIAPTGITTGEVSGSPTVLPGGVSISPTAVGPQEALGAPTIVKGGVTITPNGVGSSEAVSNPTLIPGTARVVLTGIPSAEVLGLPALLAVASIFPETIASAEVFGLPVVKASSFIRPTGIPSEEFVGMPSIPLLLASWSWLNQSPDFGGVKERGFPELQDGEGHSKERGYPELQDGFAHSKRNEGSS